VQRFLSVRLSPFGQYGGIHDSNPMRLFTSVVEELSGYNLAYLHLIEGRGSEIGLGDELHADVLDNARIFRPHYEGILISAAAYTPETGHEAIEANHADAIAFGRLFICNPDLVERIAHGISLNAYDRSTFYGGGEHGYRLHPPLQAFIPPSTVRFAPVMYEDSGPAMNATIAAISSTCP
jgi:N-ethylmaleimide reductase